MTDTTPEPEAHDYEVSILAHPQASSPLEAYLMTVDAMIREGVDNFHPLITDMETGERWLYTPGGQLVTGEAMAAEVERLRQQFEALDGSAD